MEVHGGGLDSPFFSLNNTNAGFAYVDAAYGMVCLVVFCSLLLAPPLRRPLRHSMAQTAKALPIRFLAINAPPGENPKGSASHMQIAHAGIVFFITGVLLSNTSTQQLTYVLRYGSERLLGNQICCLRGIDHHYGPTFHAICGNLVVYQHSRGPRAAAITPSWTPPGGEMLGLTSYGSAPTGVPTANAPPATVNLAQHWVSVLVRQARLPWSEAGQAPLTCGLTTGGVLTTKRPWATNSFCAAELKAAYFSLKAKPPANQWPRQLCMFPEKRFGLANQQFSTTKVAIHTNLLTDLYGVLGAGSAENGWSTSIIQLPFMFCIWIGFVFAALGAVYSISHQLHRTPWKWY
jgi:hypothetical protein